MNRYLTKIVYQIICGDGHHLPQFDEQLRLINGFDAEGALGKAQVLGFKEEDSFCNDKQQLVQWKFVAVTELHPLHDFMDGAEMYSQIREADDAQVHLTFLRHKEKQLLLRYSSQSTLQLI